MTDTEPNTPDPAGTVARARTAVPEDLSTRRIALYLTLCTVAILILVPIEAAIVTSFKTVSGFAETLPFVPPPPDGTTLDGWIQAWTTLRGTLRNSAAFVIPATLLLPILGSLSAFGLTVTMAFTAGPALS